MRRVGKTPPLVAVIGVVVPLGLGTIRMKLMQLLHPTSALAGDLFIGGILTATSVGITARVLRDLGQENRDESGFILGDAVLSLIVLAIVSALAAPARSILSTSAASP